MAAGVAGNLVLHADHELSGRDWFRRKRASRRRPSRPDRRRAWCASAGDRPSPVFHGASGGEMGDAILRTLWRLVGQPAATSWNGALRASRSARRPGRQRLVACGWRFARHRRRRGRAHRLAQSAESAARRCLRAVLVPRRQSPGLVSAARRRPRTGCEIRPADANALRTIARTHLALFRDLRHRAEHNNLPPDNFQESPAPKLAPSAPRPPISASICCRCVSARESAGSASATPSHASARTLDTIERMPRNRGHSSTGTTPRR